MIAKGKNASELFPAVVKNVASKNIEVLFSCILLVITFVIKELLLFSYFDMQHKIFITIFESFKISIVLNTDEPE